MSAKLIPVLMLIGIVLVSGCVQENKSFEQMSAEADMWTEQQNRYTFEKNNLSITYEQGLKLCEIYTDKPKIYAVYPFDYDDMITITCIDNDDWIDTIHYNPRDCSVKEITKNGWEKFDRRMCFK